MQNIGKSDALWIWFLYSMTSGDYDGARNFSIRSRNKIKTHFP